MTNIKIALSVLGGLCLGFFDQYGTAILCVGIAVILDFATGMAKAKITGTVQSKKGFIGIWKKISLFVALFFGMFLDLFITLFALTELKLDIPFNLPFGIIVAVYIVVNESISICENLYQSGTPMPSFIINALRLAQEKIAGEQTVETIETETEDIQ